MKKCLTCKHWDTNKYDDWHKDVNKMPDYYFKYGLCNKIKFVNFSHIRYNNPIIIDINGTGGVVETFMDFYCNMWEMQNDKYTR